MISQALPTLATQASANVNLGVATHDTATLSGGVNPTGTITFALFGPNNAACSGVPAFTSTIPVAGNGSYLSGTFTPIAVGTYRWIATYSGDAGNAAAATACNDPNESVVIAQALPVLVTQASANVNLGGAIHDTATLSGGVNPTGTITFRLFGPNDAACSNLAIFTSTLPVSGNGIYVSGNFTPVAVGAYRWMASYSGDAGNAAAATACNDASESVVIAQALPVLVTQASANVNLGGAKHDSATLSGGVNATGTITFRLFGPNNAACSGVAAFTSTIPVAGNGSYLSGTFTPIAVGTYRWIATYSGDAGNAAAATACNDPNESVVISQALPALVTQTPPNASIGGAIHDTATLSGSVNATGTITFRLFGPNDATCSNLAIFTSAVPVAGNGSYLSGTFTPVAVGTYRWIANYSGDASNASATTACNDADESVVISQALPALVTQASANINLGGAIHDTAILSGAVNATGTITFRLFGPNDATCSNLAVFTSTVSVAGNGSYLSGTFTPIAVGTYRWIANYSGDASNAATVNICNGANENLVVAQVVPRLPTNASAGMPLGGTISDTAILSGAANPTGTITFDLYGPDDVTCIGAAVFMATVAVTGNGSYPSASFTPKAAGTYRWIANYGGDGSNAGTANACNDPNESVTVVATALPPSEIPALNARVLVVLTLPLAALGALVLRRR